MNDLILGIGILALLSSLLFLAGRHLGRRLSVRWAKGVGVAAVGALAAYHGLLADDILLARLLPVSNLIVVGNWTPLPLGLLAGLAWSLIPRLAVGADPARPVDQPGRTAKDAPRIVLIRRVVVVLFLGLVGSYAVIRPLWGQAPTCGNRWDGDFCLQTTDSTCTAACAVTLLRAHGIQATEGEMAALCLTRRGTVWQGLFRGLTLKTAGTPWRVEIVRGPFEGLRSLGRGPAILEAGLPRDAEVARIYTERYGWSQGEWHSVLFFGFRGNGRVAMGDPTPGIGREDWTEEDLRVLWGGRGMRLVPRNGTGAITGRDGPFRRDRASPSANTSNRGVDFPGVSVDAHGLEATTRL